MTKRITVKVDENGKVLMETKGFSGKTCTAEVEKLIKSLGDGGVVIDTKKIDYSQEYYQQTQTQQVTA